MLNFHRESWNPVKKHSKALVFFVVSKQIPIIYIQPTVVELKKALACHISMHVTLQASESGLSAICFNFISMENYHEYWYPFDL